MSAIRNPATITSVGRRMMTAGGDITYTKAVLYGQDISHLTREQLESLTSIGNPLVTVPLGISDKNDNGNGTTVILEATFQNSNLKADLPYTAVGFFAKRGDDAEKLIAVGVATEGAYLAATSPDGVATDALDIKVAIAIGDSANVTAMIDPAGSVTPAALHNAITDVKSEMKTGLDTKADKQTVTDDLAKKADKTDVDAQIGTVNKSITDVSNTVKANKDDADKALATKADKTTVEQELAVKANSSDVDKKLDEKADKSSVDAKINAIDFSKIKFRKQYLTQNGTSSDKTWNATKNSDGSYTIDIYHDDWTAYKVASLLQAITTKADQSSLDATNKTVATKANSSDVYTKKQVDDAFSSRDATIATKADKATVDAEIAKIDFTPYAKTADVNKEIKTVTDLANTKVDATYSYSKAELDKKLLALSTDTSGKVDASQVATMIENKADKSDVTKQIGTVTDLVNTKANSTDVDAALDKKDDITDVDTKIKTVTDLANTKADASSTYNKNQIDSAFSTRDSNINNVLSKLNKINGTYLIGDAVDINTLAGESSSINVYLLRNSDNKNTPSWTPDNRGDLIVINYDGNAKTQLWFTVGSGNDKSVGIRYWKGATATSWNRIAIQSDIDNLVNQIKTKADASNVYTKSDVDNKTSGTIIVGYDIPSKTTTKETNSYTHKWLVDQCVLGGFADQINQLKGRRTVNQPDFNALTDGGSYYITEPQGGKNGPTGSWGNLFVSNGNGHRISQLYFPDDGSAPFMRELDETTWHGWIQFATAEQINTVNSTLNTKANTSDVNSALNTKANTSDVSALQNKVNVDDNLYSAPGSVTSWASLQAGGSKNVLRSVRTEGHATDFNTGNYDAGILFGGSDTKALISVACTGNRAIVTGGNNLSVWHEDIAWKSDVTNLQNQVNTKASASDVNSLNQTISALQQTIQSLQNTVNQQATTITGLQTQVSNQASEIKQLQETTIKGKTFSKSQEAAAEAWEKQNSQQIAFILDN